MNKKGKIISIAAVLAMLASIFVLPASAVLLGVNGFYFEFENDDAVLKEYHSSNTEVEIPADVYEHKVAAIAEYTFLRNTKIVSVTVPDTVTRIGNSAFYGCESLESIVIPASVTTFGNSVFANCENLTIKCYTGSAAEVYAQDNNIPYILLDKKIYRFGDADLDEKISSADSLMILRASVYLEDLSEVQNVLSDVDGDKEITSADALDVLRYSVGLPVASQVGEEIDF